MTGTVIGITGYAQHGKDTVADYLVSKYGYTKFAFADTLKSLACTLDPLIPHPEGNEYVGLNTYVKYLGWEEAKKNPEVRRFLQVLGSEGVRDHLGEDTWVNALFNRWDAEDSPNLVISDVRFPNEATSVDVLIRVTRYVEGGVMFDNGVGIDHPSERHVATLPANFDIFNLDTLNELYQKVDAVMFDIAEGFIPGGHVFPYTVGV